jgi:hypothetical protein
LQEKDGDADEAKKDRKVVSGKVFAYSHSGW